MWLCSSIVFLALLSPTVRGFAQGSSTSSSTSTTCRAATVASTDTPDILPDFDNRESYLAYMESVSALPKGFAVGTAQGTFVAPEAPALGPLPIQATVIHLTEGPTDNWAAVFTKNKFPGAPVIVGRQRLAQGGPLHALVINNKVSNVCSGGDGVADSEQVCQAVADGLNLDSARLVLPSSTGVIGWRLPASELTQHVIPAALQQLQVSTSSSALAAAQAICTTDRYPKVRSVTLSNGARIVAIAKGAGMIEPNMATMLSYIMTDATVPRQRLQALLHKVTEVSFNSISVDGSESTSDTVALVASNQVGEAVDDAEFEAALTRVCRGLAADIVRNGEGTGHVLRVTVQHYPGSDAMARRLGRHTVNYALFKCAVAGNDPNTGRLAGAVGSFLGRFADNDDDLDISQMTLTLGGRVIFSQGQFVLEGDAVERELSQHMEDAEFNDHSDYPPHQKFVEIGIDFGAGGTGTAVVIGSDLTAEYVSINADYRS